MPSEAGTHRPSQVVFEGGCQRSIVLGRQLRRHHQRIKEQLAAERAEGAAEVGPRRGLLATTGPVSAVSVDGA